MIRRRTITSYVWNSVSGNKMVILSNCIRNFFRKFELLGNSTQSENPAPDNPQETKSAGRKSKNLFNIADLRVGQVQKDGTINEKQIYYRTVILDVPQDGKYRITFNSNDDYTMLYFTEAYANGVYSNPYLRVHAGSPNYYITLAKGKNILSFSTHTASGNIAFTTDHNIMIAAESETLDYEPYGYFFDVKVTGKNLFDSEYASNSSNWVDTGDGFRTFSKPLTTNGEEYTISTIELLKADLGFNFLISESFEVLSAKHYYFYHNSNSPAIKDKITTRGADNLYLKMTGNFDSFASNLLNILQFEKGNNKTDYEPYTEQFMQIVLNEPLRGIGEYKDTITKDGVVRKIKRIMFDENTPFKEYNAPVQVKTTSFISGTTIKDATGETGIEVMSDRFKTKDRGFDRYDEECITLFGKSIFVRFNKDKNINTEEALTEWLKQNPLTVDYVLAEPVTEPLPESVQAQLSALHSENGTTHVFVDSGEVPCGINIEYKYKS